MMSGRVFSFHYVLTNKEGELLDTSRGADPLSFMTGKQQIIPGLEDEICRMNPGEKKKITIPHDKAYGTVNDELKVRVNRAQLPVGEIKVGTRFSGAEQGPGPVFIVVAIEGDEIFLDGNHPLAGEDLTFEVEIAEIRQATQEEMEHGHTHGPGGHHQHHH